ncbi:DUF427 domain-containing protein [Phyllobacterium sp. P30BS-XVII]|uniref:DUF427 domain-containing protein n=1 Tax=Phyllobacterium sp. P30BS-XVII TaxID=2587046 RepID=UPI0015F8DB8D|nr:DUF427 domain-containing protein [Phyllobacterium sp. P30BS-XVII]MBA8901075.1 uncharacterized protein (DUF427 family) [Phyllobacterium sp. P30BS-XVII]
MSISYRSNEIPAILIEPTYRRIRLKLGEEVIADSAKAIVVYENGGHPVYYLPKSDFREDALEPSSKTGASPVLGPRRYWSLAGEDSAWSYENAPDGVPNLADYVTVAWSAVRWFEEDEEIFGHPRNVHWRIDTINSSRLVEVFVDGKLVARTNRAIFLFETSLITRYYFPVEDLIAGTLVQSPLHSYCPYKGKASYYHFELDGKRHENIVWYYPEPLYEAGRIKGFISFYNEKIDNIRVSAGDAE